MPLIFTREALRILQIFFFALVIVGRNKLFDERTDVRAFAVKRLAQLTKYIIQVAFVNVNGFSYIDKTVICSFKPLFVHKKLLVELFARSKSAEFDLYLFVGNEA